MIDCKVDCFNETDITQNLGAQDHKHKPVYDVHVSRHGKDASGCGSLEEPCGSITQAMRLVDWGGRVHLNGTGTERDPFGCENVTHDQNPGMFANKSVTMQSFQATPYVSCVEGFHFQTVTPRKVTEKCLLHCWGSYFKELLSGFWTVVAFS